MKSQNPDAQCAESIFQMQYPICAVDFTNNTSKSGWRYLTRLNLWKLVPINFKDKYFHNSVD